MNLLTKHKQQGFTLIEMLISVFISTIMITITMVYIAQSRETFRSQDMHLIIEENSRYIFQKLFVDIARTGFLDPAIASFNANRSLNSLFYTGNCGGLNPCTANGNNTDPDRIAVIYQPTATTALACNGTDISAALVPTNALINSYFIQADPTTNLNNLYCRTFSLDLTTANAPAVPLIDPSPVLEGIENIQFLYGIYDSVDNPIVTQTIPTSYVSAARVTDWNAISAVKVVALVGTGLAENQGFQDQQSFQLAEAPTYTPQNGDYCFFHRCRVYTSTTEIKNRFDNE